MISTIHYLTVQQIIKKPTFKVPQAILSSSTAKVSLDYYEEVFKLQEQDIVSITLSTELNINNSYNYVMHGIIYEINDVVANISCGGLLCSIENEQPIMRRDMINKNVYLCVTIN